MSRDLGFISGLKAFDVASDVPTCYVNDPLAIALNILAMKRAPRRIILIDQGRRVRGVITALRILEILLSYRGASLIRSEGLTKVLREEVYLFADEAPYTMEMNTPLPAVIMHMGENNISMIPLIDSVGVYRGAVTEKQVASLASGRRLGLKVSEYVEDYPIVYIVDSVLRASEAMIRSRKAKAVVIDEGGRAVGVVTASDILRMPLLTEEIIDLLRADVEVSVERILSTIPVSKVMSAPAITVGEDEDLGYAAEIFTANDIGIMPITRREEGGKMIGVISRMGVVRALARVLRGG
ncbi:MAG: CBS domain-containing protein [Sulfolobales archaeon]